MVEGVNNYNFPQRIMKSIPSRALIIRINLIFLTIFILIYTTLLLRPSLSAYHENAASIFRCPFRECHHKEEIVNRVKAELEETNELTRIPRLLRKAVLMGNKKKKKKVGMVNVDEELVREWNRESKHLGEAKAVRLERVVEGLFKWEELFPEWIDEEEESEVPTCPEIPMPEMGEFHGGVGMIVAEVGCGRRDVSRLQVHLAVATLAVERGMRGLHVAFRSGCRPMLELFRCSEMVGRDGDWWLFRPDLSRLAHKLSLPVGSCQLALPLWGRGVDEPYEIPKIPNGGTRTEAEREAYATVLHSSEAYVCGAIALAQSLRRSNTTRDLVLLHDASISRHKLAALSAAGWRLRLITRIRNPNAEPGTYNEYNYSKLRLWQLTEYRKLIFVDADVVVLRNLDVLFRFPEITAVGNDFSLFNSGVMVIEPSNCTFRVFLESIKGVVSYNGGDQGFLNEMMVWWHRVPRRVNYLKNFWENSTVNEIAYKTQLFAADPPKVYAIHYLGWKPWLCYRDYDCNWDKPDTLVYASDVAHRRWWSVHDSMDLHLQNHCRLTKQRRVELDWDRSVAMRTGLENAHWNISITDPRRLALVD